MSFSFRRIRTFMSSAPARVYFRWQVTGVTPRLTEVELLARRRYSKYAMSKSDSLAAIPAWLLISRTLAGRMSR